MNTLRTTHPRVLRLTTSALLLSIMLVALNVSSAEAWTQKSSGSAGFVQPYQVQGLTTGFVLRPTIRVPGPTVYRSPATSGAQNVIVYYQLRRWNGSSWVDDWSSAAQVFVIPSGTSAIRLPNFDFRDLSGTYRVVSSVSWFNRSTGQHLGTRALFMDGWDYGCRNSNVDLVYMRCQAGFGSISVSPRQY
jgi:hypothetical protein